MISYLTFKKDIAVIKSSEIEIEPEISDISTFNLAIDLNSKCYFRSASIVIFQQKGSCDKEALYGAEIL